MARQPLRVLRGTEAQFGGYIGGPGEPGFATDSARFRVMDGITPGGIAMAPEKFAPGLVGSYDRTLDEKTREQSKSFLDFMPKSIRDGYKSGTAIDLTQYLQKALDSGQDLFMPPNLPTVRITSYLQQTTPRQIVNWSLSTPMLYDAPAGSPVTPAWIIREGAESAAIRRLNVNHQSEGSRYLSPTLGGNQIALGTTIVLMADRCRADDCVVYNAWDNGIGIGKFSLTELKQFNGSPIAATVSGAQTFNCGVGYHQDGEQAGGGVNVLCGSRSMVVDCSDVGSLTGFIGDFASGAGGIMIGCRSSVAKTSATPSSGLSAGLIGGYGFYFGANHMVVVGCSADDAAQVGFWVDGFAYDVKLKGCRAKGCRKQGLLLQGGYNSAEDFVANSCSYLNQNAFPAIEVRGTWIDGPSQNSICLMLINPTTLGDFHHTGVLVVADNNRTVTGQLNGGFLNGASKAFDRRDQTNFNANDYRVASFNALQSAGTKLFSSKNRSAKVSAFGDFDTNGTLFLVDETNPSKRVAAGYDPVRDRGVMQAIESGATARPMEINPSGGPVMLGKSGPARDDAGSVVYIPSMDGSPTAAPTVVPGMIPIVFDAANARFYAYFDVGWKQIGFA